MGIRVSVSMRRPRALAVYTVGVCSLAVGISSSASAQNGCTLGESGVYCDGFESAGLLTAQPDNVTTNQGTSSTVDVLANDRGLGDGPLTLTIYQAPANGGATVGSDNRITYTPNIPNDTFLGNDSFRYLITDQDGATSVGTVNVSVTCPSATCDRTFVLSWDPVDHPAATGYCVYHDTSARPGSATPASNSHYADRECVGDVTTFEWTLPVVTGTDYFAVSTLAEDASESAYSDEFPLVSF